MTRFAQLIRWFMFFVLGSMLAACAAQTGGGGGMSAAAITCTTSPAPSFSGNVQSILANRCTSCHSEFTTFSRASSAASSIQSQVSQGQMPPGGGLGTAEKNAIVQWVACGSKQ